MADSGAKEMPEIYELGQTPKERGPNGVILDRGVHDKLIPALQRGEMVVKDDDIFIVSYPKSGTNTLCVLKYTEHGLVSVETTSKNSLLYSILELT